MNQYTAQDFKKGQPRWCPGCGDHFFLASLQKAMAELGVPPYETAVISGIGCSSRLPYYANTYAMQTIHGRAAAISTGAKVTNPNLTIWQVSGDGDALAIGGNHFIHAMRRNVDLNMILLNNRIYGLTKGQYSPTSPRGFVSKSSPFGTTEDPFRPAELCFGARGNFFARAIDVDMKTLQECFVASARHRGFAVTEVLVNCVIFNDGTHKNRSHKDIRADRTITLRHGEKMVFGANRDKGIVLEGLKLRAVTIGEDGYTLDDVLVHDKYEQDVTLHHLLAMMGYTDDSMPIALGVIRDVEAPCYDRAVEAQIEEIQQKNPIRKLHDLLIQGDVWEIK